MKFSEEKLKELEGIRESFYRVLRNLDILKPDDNGIITAWGGRRLLWLDSETFAIPIEIMGPVQNKIMYNLGLKAGEAIAEGLNAKKRPKEKIEILLKLFKKGGMSLVKDAIRTEKRNLPEIAFKCWGYAKYAGWGSNGTSIEIDEKNSKAEYSMENTFESYARKKRRKYKRPSCYLVSGTLGGLFKFWFKRDDLVCKEVECISEGDPKCRWVIAPKKKIDEE